jgi:hypothetical protein
MKKIIKEYFPSILLLIASIIFAILKWEMTTIILSVFFVVSIIINLFEFE